MMYPSIKKILDWVIPAKAGICRVLKQGIPAFAGMTRGILICCLSLLLLSCATTNMRNTQELQLGKANFESGFFRDAFRQLLPLAYNGNPDAQYAVGYMYYYGYGVSQDTDTGTFWIKKSADQGYPKAIDALQAMKNPNAPTAY